MKHVRIHLSLIPMLDIRVVSEFFTVINKSTTCNPWELPLLVPLLPSHNDGITFIQWLYVLGTVLISIIQMKHRDIQRVNLPRVDSKLAQGKNLNPGSLTSELLILKHTTCCSQRYKYVLRKLYRCFQTLNSKWNIDFISLYPSLNH